MQTRTELTLITKAKAEIEKLLEEAVEHHMHVAAARSAVENGQQLALFHAWQSGIRLNKIKSIVGHGNWQAWVEGNVRKPQGISDRTVRLYMKIDADNPELREGKANRQRVADLKFDTVRKYAIGFVPEKDKPELQNNATFPRLMHHLKLVNEFNRWKRRRDTGQIESNPKEERRDFKEMYDWLRTELYGDDG